MTTATSIVAGKSQQLNLTVTPTDADLSTLGYSVTPAGLVTLSPDPAGVLVTALKAGIAKVVASVAGEDASGQPATITTECDVTVTAPLARALSLDPVS